MVDGIAGSFSELGEDLSRKANAGHPVLASILLPLSSKHRMGSFSGDEKNFTHGPTILHCSHLSFLVSGISLVGKSGATLRIHTLEET